MAKSFDLGQFDRDARMSAEQVVSHATEEIRSAALDLYSNLTTDAKTMSEGGTPVASGRYSGSMRLSLNEIDTSVEPADPNYHYPSGHGPRQLPPRTIPNRPISSIAARLRTFRLGDTIWISNSLPYVRRIELGRHSWQTPEGAFDPTVRGWLVRFANLAARVVRV